MACRGNKKNHRESCTLSYSGTLSHEVLLRIAAKPVQNNQRLNLAGASSVRSSHNKQSLWRQRQQSLCQPEKDLLRTTPHDIGPENYRVSEFSMRLKKTSSDSLRFSTPETKQQLQSHCPDHTVSIHLLQIHEKFCTNLVWPLQSPVNQKHKNDGSCFLSLRGAEKCFSDAFWFLGTFVANLKTFPPFLCHPIIPALILSWHLKRLHKIHFSMWTHDVYPHGGVLGFVPLMELGQPAQMFKSLFGIQSMKALVPRFEERKFAVFCA